MIIAQGNIDSISPSLDAYEKSANSEIRYASHESLFGTLFIAQTEFGICRVSFIDQNSEEYELKILSKRFPLAIFLKDKQSTEYVADAIFVKSPRTKFTFHISGTHFQLAVWQALLGIPLGQVMNYGELATQLNNPGASRAVGTAIGANPLALLIPCHRVIQKSGALGGYRWGAERKQAILLW